MTETTKASTLAPIIAPRLPYVEQARGYGFDQDAWRVLTDAIFPGAESPASVLLALAYCKSRGLDPLKRPVHIVPVWDSKRKRMVETLWPGIGELRTTAARTGQFAGRDDTAFGPDATEVFGPDDDGAKIELTYPSWAQVTVYRLVGGQRCAFVGPKVWWKEAYATRKSKSDVPNSMWQDRPRGQLDKCAEAAALRAAFPEEIGGDLAAEEIGTRREREYQTVAQTPGGQEIQMPRRRGESVPAPAPQPKPQPAPSAADAMPNPLVTCIVAITTETGERNSKKWTRYVLETEQGDKLSTFSSSVAAFAREAGKLPVAIQWERKGEFLNAVAVGPAVEPEPAAKPQPQPAAAKATESRETEEEPDPEPSLPFEG